jgi:hypothetical protein
VDTSTTGDSTSFSLVLKSAFLTLTSFLWLKVFRGGGVDWFGHLKVFFSLVHRVCEPLEVRVSSYALFALVTI